MKPRTRTTPKAPARAAYLAGSDPLVVAPPAVTGLAGALMSFTPEPLAYDPKRAAELLLAHTPRLQAIAADRLRVPRLDIDLVCHAILNAHALAQAPVLHARFKAVADAGEIDLASLDRLGDLALIQLHTYRLADAAGAFASTARIPAALDKESAEVEARIQKVCEHFFADHPVIGRVLRRLSPGTGFRDRAYDLLGYADIYEAEHAVVSRDPLYYRKTDVADARRLAGQILGQLGAAMSPQARSAFDLFQRVWTLLEVTYLEVRAVGLCLLRHDPRREERFPSLYVVGRPGQGRRKGKKGDEEEETIAEEEEVDEQAEEAPAEKKAAPARKAPVEKKAAPAKKTPVEKKAPVEDDEVEEEEPADA